MMSLYKSPQKTLLLSSIIDEKRYYCTNEDSSQDLSLYFEHWIYFQHGNMYSKFEVYCCCAESRVGLAWDTHNFGRQEKCWQNVGKVLLMWQHHFVAIEELETDIREVSSFANTSTYHGLTQDTIYYKWASVKMTLKFHFLWSTSLYQLYILIGWEANPCLS